MDLFGFGARELESAGAHWTAREICQQPRIWLDVERLMTEQSDALSRFLAPHLARPELHVVLTGAGTSSFVGQCLALALAGRVAHRVEAIATTDLVAGPQRWLSRESPTLLVSFARSGNSPESVAAVNLAEQCVDRCFHLVVTCNADGALCRRACGMNNAYAIVLPELSNDRGFAMTSSFTGMLLAAAMAFRIVPTDGTRSRALARLAAQVIPDLEPLLHALVAEGFERVVYLGSNELGGLAREAALKMLELTDGRVIATGDTPLGFRHGPKTILNHNSLVILFVSGDPYTQRYELDLLNELRRDSVARRVVALWMSPPAVSHRDDVVLAHPAPDVAASGDLESCFPYVIFAQVLALLRSMSLGIRPDTPNAAGTVSRVVQGVSIYPWTRPR